MQYTPCLYCGDIIVCLVSMGHKRCVGDRSKVTSFFLSCEKQMSTIKNSKIKFKFYLASAAVYYYNGIYIPTQ